MSALDPIFCGVGLDRTPLLTRVRVLPWQKDTLQGVHEERGEEKGEQEKKDRKEERKEILAGLLVSLRVGGEEEPICWRNGCLGWGRTRLEGRPGDEETGGRGRSAPTYTFLNRYTFDLR